jgi:hypothetical protein
MDFLRRREAAGKLTDWQRGLLERLENFSRKERERVIAELQAQLNRLLEDQNKKKGVKRNDGNADQAKQWSNPSSALQF